LTVAASLLVCAGIFAVIVGSVKEPPPSLGEPQAAQEKKAPPEGKSSSPEELGLAEQIAFQEALLKKTSDEKERALIQATIRTLQAELARAQKGKTPAKKSPEALAERAAQLRQDLDSVQMKLKSAKTIEDSQRLEAKAAALAEELGYLEKGNLPPTKDPGGKASGKGDPGRPDSPKTTKDPKAQITALEERLAELKSILSSAELAEADRAKAQKEFAQLQAELERLKAAASVDKNEKKK
jgi:DNA repair exonuclease SbcCD ATPase subunit